MPDPMVHPETAADSPFTYDPWTWREPMRGEHFRRCSFCGSIHPEDLVAEATWRADWADQKYGWPHKFYVDITNRTPERKRVITALTEQQYQDSLGGKDWPVRHDAFEWRRVGDVPEGYVADGWREDGRYAWYGFGSDAMHHAKFYTVHLKDGDLNAAAKAKIERVSGLRFEFDGDRVAWFRSTP
ncbi:MAG TPA: hypothetical protein VFQ42_04125 [Mycobacterium sp.]|nr:hypothetical protein [Mycobacterium sp.]